MSVAPTPRDVIFRDGASRLLRFRAVSPGASDRRPVVLLVPSLINRWYVIDLREGASLADALRQAGFDVWCLDWGVSGDEDRYLTWDDILARLARMRRVVHRRTGASSIGLLGYCVGGTLAAIHSALEPRGVGTLVNLAGPIDFSVAGRLRRFVDPAWFDGETVGRAGNVSPAQMQSGFVALRPTSQVSKLVMAVDVLRNPSRRTAFRALQTWADDNVPFPGAAYGTYIRELYQQNALAEGRHHVAGRRVDLGVIRCPVLTVVTTRDTICPPPAALALGKLVGSEVAEVLEVAGGHVGAVVGSRAARELYPGLTSWFRQQLAQPAPEEATTDGNAAAAGMPC